VDKHHILVISIVAVVAIFSMALVVSHTSKIDALYTVGHAHGVASVRDVSQSNVVATERKPQMESSVRYPGACYDIMTSTHTVTPVPTGNHYHLYSQFRLVTSGDCVFDELISIPLPIFTDVVVSGGSQAYMINSGGPLLAESLPPHPLWRLSYNAPHDITIFSHPFIQGGSDLSGGSTLSTTLNEHSASLAGGTSELRITGQLQGAGTFTLTSNLFFAGELLGDLDGDGKVDNADLLILLEAWGNCPLESCPEDLNGDGVVNIADLLILLNNWSEE